GNPGKDGNPGDDRNPGGNGDRGDENPGNGEHGGGGNPGGRNPGGGRGPDGGRGPQSGPAGGGTGAPGLVPAIPPGGLAAHVNLTVPLTTALHLADRPGQLARTGPIDPDLARDLVAS